MALMTSYKPGQGRQARNLASILILFVVAWGCYAFMEFGNSKLDRMLGAFFGYDKAVMSAPLLGSDNALTTWVTPSMLLAIALFAALFFWVRGFLNRPRVADHLIGTELEMRRVKWPTRKEVTSATIVVLTTSAPCARAHAER